MLDQIRQDRPGGRAFPAPSWAPDRWRSIRRDYPIEEVERLSGSLPIRHTLAENGARRLWELLHSEDYVPTLGTFTGNQAVQQVKAGLKAIYLSGWQVAADANSAGQMYPDQSLYPVDSVPSVVRRINRALQRADQIQTMERHDGRSDETLDYFVPIIADAEAGFGGPLNAFELMKAMIEAGAAAVHFEDQLASEKKCGHLGGKVLLPTSGFIRTLNAARLAADIMGVPTLIMARTDAEAARLITSDIDEEDAPFITGERTAEGFHRLKPGTAVPITGGSFVLQGRGHNVTGTFVRGSVTPLDGPGSCGNERFDVTGALALRGGGSGSFAVVLTHLRAPVRAGCRTYGATVIGSVVVGSDGAA